jgi:hypothetical protein
MPLAHILAPQIARKAEEIQAQLEPHTTSYLQTIGAEDPQAQAARGTATTPTEAAPYADPKQAPWVMGALQAMGAAPEPMRRAFIDRMTKPTPDANAMIAGEQVDPFKEPPAKSKRLPRTIHVDPNAPAGIDEAGHALDAKGHNLGYLQQAGMQRDLLRRPSDVRDSEKDPFAKGVLGADYDLLKKQYGLEADDYKANGYKWPKDYFAAETDKKKVAATKAAAIRLLGMETDSDPKTGKPVVY